MFLRNVLPIARFRRKAPFSTLSPSSLTPSDWVNFAGKPQPRISFTPTVGNSALLKPTPGYLGYYARISSYQRTVAIPFPPGSEGFLYYKAPSGHPAAGQVRFRLTSSPDPSSFTNGSDLLLPSGIPWGVPAPAMAANRYAPLRACLLHSHDLSPADVEGWSGPSMPTRVMARSHVLNTPDDVFPINFASASAAGLWIANGSNLHYVMLRRTAAVGLGRMDVSPYTGQAICKLEYYPTIVASSEDPVPAFAIRVIRITQPIVPKSDSDHPKIDLADMERFRLRIPIPKEGELISRVHAGVVIPKLYPVQSHPALRFLMPEETRLK